MHINVLGPGWVKVCSAQLPLTQPDRRCFISADACVAADKQKGKRHACCVACPVIACSAENRNPNSSAPEHAATKSKARPGKAAAAHLAARLHLQPLLQAFVTCATRQRQVCLSCSKTFSPSQHCSCTSTTNSVLFLHSVFCVSGQINMQRVNLLDNDCMPGVGHRVTPTLHPCLSVRML